MAYGSRCAAEARRARRSSRAVGRQQADCDALRGERRFSRACREASCRADLARGRCPGLGEKLTTTSARTAPQGLQADLRAATRSRARFTRTPCCVRYECCATKDSSSSDAGVAFRSPGRPNVVSSSSARRSWSSSPGTTAIAWTNSSRSSKTWAEPGASLKGYSRTLGQAAAMSPEWPTDTSGLAVIAWVQRYRDPMVVAERGQGATS